MAYQVKEGDVLEYRGDGKWDSYHVLTVGKRYTINEDAFGLYIVADNGKHALAVANFPVQYGFHIVPSTPPATIQHEGYNYTRGEPVVPDWVKDGAWVVHKESGKIGKVSKAYKGSAYFKPLDKTFRVNFTNHLVADDFRPFTDADWKWGMWAEYKGEKVFVHCTGLTGIFASRTGNGYFLAHFSEITPTTAP